MFSEEYIKKLVDEGCRRWTKYGKDRLYLNAEALGLWWKGRTKSSGSLYGCFWRDESISNKSGNGLFDILNDGCYVDLMTGNLHYIRHTRYGTNGTILDALKELKQEFKDEFNRKTELADDTQHTSE